MFALYFLSCWNLPSLLFTALLILFSWPIYSFFFLFYGGYLWKRIHIVILSVFAVVYRIERLIKARTVHSVNSRGLIFNVTQFLSVLSERQHLDLLAIVQLTQSSALSPHTLMKAIKVCESRVKMNKNTNTNTDTQKKNKNNTEHNGHRISPK